MRLVSWKGRMTSLSSYGEWLPILLLLVAYMSVMRWLLLKAGGPTPLAGASEQMFPIGCGRKLEQEIGERRARARHVASSLGKQYH
jgi:hypothetical protein